MEITSFLARLQPSREKADSSETGARRKVNTETRSGSGRDRVSLSPEAKRAASQAAEASARQRQLKVNNIKESVENGAYEVDSQKIAKKLIEQDPEFFLAGIKTAGPGEEIH